MRRLARYVATFLLLITGANVLTGEEPHVSFVPWKVLAPGTKVDAPLMLFWIPATTEELRRSRLLTSDELTMFSARCVAMRILRFDDIARLASLEVETEELPLAILVDAQGQVLARANASDVAEVERMVREAIAANEREAELELDAAEQLANAQDVDSAVRLYGAVWEKRCLCPRQAKDAQRALKKLKK